MTKMSGVVCLSLLVLATGVVSAAAQSGDRSAGIPARERVGFAAIRESDLRANLAFLSSDGLAGRMSLQPGDEAAAAWVASEFAKAGLIPAARDEQGRPSYLQAMPLVEYVPDRAGFALTLTRGGRQTVWRPGAAYQSAPQPPPSSGMTPLSWITL